MLHPRFKAINSLFLEIEGIFIHMYQEMGDKQLKELYKMSEQNLINDHTADEAFHLIQGILDAIDMGNTQKIKDLISQYGVFLGAIAEMFINAGKKEHKYIIQDRMSKFGPVLLNVVDLYADSIKVA